MDRIDTSTRAQDLFGPGKDGFRDGNLALGTEATAFNAAWPNAIQEELLAVIEAAGLTPDAGTLNQLLLALKGASLFDTADPGDSSRLVATTEFVALALAALASAFVPVPVGATIYMPSLITPVGFVKVNGAPMNRTTYAALWAYVQASGNLAATEGVKQRGQFGPGDGINTFTLPNPRGLFIRTLSEGDTFDAGRGMGTYQADELRSHAHTFNAYGSTATQLAAGSTSNPGTFSGQTTSNVGGAETRPANIAWPAYMKY